MGDINLKVTVNQSMSMKVGLKSPVQTKPE